MKKIQIAPSILSCDFLNLGSEIQKVEKEKVEWIHVDVMDGHFVPNLSIGIPVIKALKKKIKTPLDVHLMIQNPDTFLDPFLDAKSDSITFHIEASKNPMTLIKHIKKRSIQVGLAIKPNTSIQKVKPFLSLLDMVLIMTVEPGFGGQKFMEGMMDKVAILRNTWKWGGLIQVDGGIDATTASISVQAGANVLVVGSAIFGKEDLRLAIQEIRNSWI